MMDQRTRSPQRQHILSSINPEDSRDPSPERRRRRHRSSRSPRRDQKRHRDDGGREEAKSREDRDGETSRPRSSRLKLKDEKSRSRRRRHHDRSDDLSRPSRRDRPRSRSRSRSPTSRSSRRHRHRHRRHRSPTPPNPHLSPPLDPEAAFRESLFDAMADDEGAAYWEGVYGQPVHIYEDDYQAHAEGSLEGMTEEEYAAYVRQKMWEKTNAGLLEERARREEMRKEKEAQDRRRRELHEETLRGAKREEDQRLKRRWEKRFAEYLKRWDEIPTAFSSSRPLPSAETILPWPIDSGRREDISESAVRSFFIRGLNAEGKGERALAAGLREERVRWHPDKVQQRLGGEVQEEVMRDVTAIFQAVDRLWAEVKGKG